MMCWFKVEQVCSLIILSAMLAASKLIHYGFNRSVSVFRFLSDVPRVALLCLAQLCPLTGTCCTFLLGVGYPVSCLFQIQAMQGGVTG